MTVLAKSETLIRVQPRPVCLDICDCDLAGDDDEDPEPPGDQVLALSRELFNELGTVHWIGEVLGIDTDHQGGSWGDDDGIGNLGPFDLVGNTRVGVGAEHGGL